MTDLNSYFTHGDQYIGNYEDKPRKSCCGSCAFGNAPNTVRPKDVALKDLEIFASDLDVFYCHNPDEKGVYKICPKWFALVDGNLNNLCKSEQEINDILERA